MSDTKELCGCEALARWIDPKYGFLSQGDFIPILEENRLIHKLDVAIFESVWKDLRSHIDSGKPFVPVSLNFSRLDFELMDAVTVLNDLVTKYNVPRDYIHVEVTESAFTDNMDILKQSMDRFHELGFAIWLDDFGSGYSSLNVLKYYRFDALKIDMKFLSSFDKNPKSKDIIKSVVGLAKKVGMKTLTESVETKEQAEFLNVVGCGRLQGYLFGKPLPVADIDDGIETGK
jgi:EAL domain-containing protein (putative c-di-GMP-specific phosphodiesterase class I)